MEAARMRDEVAGAMTDQSQQTPSEAPRHASFPAVELSPDEQRVQQPMRQFVAVSNDGNVLVVFGADGARTAEIARLAVEIELWPADAPKPELFEATTAKSEIAVQLQAESLVVAIRDKGEPR